MKCKFNVGDKVIGTTYNYSITCKGWIGEVVNVSMDGKSFTAFGLNPQGKKQNFHCLAVDHFELYEARKTEHTTNEKIVITVDGRTTLARLYKDGKVVKSAEARCCPEDDFDFNVGANIAYSRLMGVPTGEEKKEEPKSVKEVQSNKFKRGDKVVVRKNTCSHFAKIGDVIILKDIWRSRLGFRKRVMWNYTHGDTVEDRDACGFIVEDDIELYDTLKLTIEDLEKMHGQKVWCSRLDDECEEYFSGMWYAGEWFRVDANSKELIASDGAFHKFSELGTELGYNAYLTEQKR